MPEQIKLKPGQIYWCGSDGWYYCLDSDTESADVVNVKSGWRCTAHLIMQYPSTKVVWAYSVGGRFDDAAKLRAQIAELDTLHTAIEDARLACHCLTEECKTALDAAVKAVHGARSAAITALCDMLREVHKDA